MQFCVFSMQICNYRAYSTIPRNEFSKNDQDCRKNTTDMTIVSYGYSPGSTDLWWVDCRSDDLKFPFLCSFYVFIHVFVIVKVFRYFLDRNIISAKSPTISGRTGDLLLTMFGKFYVPSVNHLSENQITAKRRVFFHQYSPSMNFYSFY